MPDPHPYRTILWAGQPLYTCPGCAFQRFNEVLVAAHCATCPSLAALLAHDPGPADAVPAPSRDDEEGP